jgi:hypothetical protein
MIWKVCRSRYCSRHVQVNHAAAQAGLPNARAHARVIEPLSVNTRGDRALHKPRTAIVLWGCSRGVAVCLDALGRGCVDRVLPDVSRSEPVSCGITTPQVRGGRGGRGESGAGQRHATRVTRTDKPTMLGDRAAHAQIHQPRRHAVAHGHIHAAAVDGWRTGTDRSQHRADDIISTWI